MLNKENQDLKFTSNCIKDCPFVFIVRSCDPDNGNIRVVMLEIDEAQEKELDAGKSLSIEKGGLSFVINPENCLAYGEFDLSPNSKDIEDFDNADWFSRLYVRQYVPSVYDYETHTVTSDLRRGRWFDTSNLKTYLPYLYACINKPKRICIFKEYIDVVALRKAKRMSEYGKEYAKKNREVIAKKKQQKRIAKRLEKLNKLVFKV